MIVNTSRGVVTPASPPSLYVFNHVILAIRLPEAVPSPDNGSLFVHARLGRLLIFDPTAEFTPYGQTPTCIQGNTVLLVASGSGSWSASGGRAPKPQY